MRDRLTNMNSTIAILLGLTIFFAILLILAYARGWAVEIKILMASVFSGWNGALALALKTSASVHPTPAEPVAPDSAQPQPQ